MRNYSSDSLFCSTYMQTRVTRDFDNVTNTHEQKFIYTQDILFFVRFWINHVSKHLPWEIKARRDAIFERLIALKKLHDEIRLTVCIFFFQKL